METIIQASTTPTNQEAPYTSFTPLDEQNYIRGCVFYELEMTKRDMQKLKSIRKQIKYLTTAEEKNAALISAKLTSNLIQRLNLVPSDLEHPNLFGMLYTKIPEYKNSIHRSTAQKQQDILVQKFQDAVVTPIEKKIFQNSTPFMRYLHIFAIYASRLVMNAFSWTMLLLFSSMALSPIVISKLLQGFAGGYYIDMYLYILAISIVCYVWWLSYYLKDLKYYWNNTIYMFNKNVQWSTRLLWVASFLSVILSYWMAAVLIHGFLKFWPFYILTLITLPLVLGGSIRSFVETLRAKKRVQKRTYVYNIGASLLCIIGLANILMFSYY